MKLFENFPSFNRRTLVCRIDDGLTYDRLLVEHSIDPLVTEVALIFFGHGGKDRLISHYDSKSNQPANSPAFFDISHVNNGPRYLLAFCSSAATKLGRAYRDLTTGCTFVGFDHEIGLVLQDGDYLECWRKIIYEVTSAMFATTDVEALETSVSALYQDALSFFSQQKHQYSTLMRIFLRQQMQVIHYIRT
jgi:hypothetical protein